jgi:D-alanyl-D-alanine carboxypeptidase/D-alanyl-D-alanine-endopeptidase (penicillin-binding protein 4)
MRTSFRRRRVVPWITVAGVLGLLSVAAAAELPAPLQNAIAQSGISARSVAVYARVLGEREPIVAHAEQRPLVAASLMKQVTTAAALDQLGPDYTWTTSVYARGPVRDGVLHGDLWLKGSGDPKLDLERFRTLLREIWARGIRDVRGSLGIDRSAFEDRPVDPGAFDGESMRIYNVDADALLLNYNSIRLGFFAGAGGGVEVDVAPPLPSLRVDNRLQLVDMPCGGWRKQLEASVETQHEGAKINLTGRFSSACGDRFWFLNLLPRNQYLYGSFQALWHELGGTVGGFRDGTVPADARLVFEFRSTPLSELIRDMNKYSNNVMAKNIFLSIAATQVGTPARQSDAQARVLRWWQEKGFRAGEMVLENGSGLSREERISARALGELLVWAYGAPTMPEFVASLAVPGKDGTLWRRFADLPINGRAHLKTGLIDGVRGLAGYLLDAAGRRVVLVLLINDPRAEAAIPVQEALLRWLHERP